MFTHPGGENFKFLKTAENVGERVKVAYGRHKSVMAYVCQYCKASFARYTSLRSHKNGLTRNDIVSCVKLHAPLRSEDVSDGELSDGGVISPIRNPYDIKHEICRRHQDDCVLGPHLRANFT